MARVLFVTTSYPKHAGDPAGHFVEAEAKRRARNGDTVVVLAPGCSRSQRAGVTVEALPGVSAFGWPGALSRLRRRPHLAIAAGAFVVAARRRIRLLGAFDDVVAHWTLPGAFPIACAAVGPLEVVVHGSDARLLLRLPRALKIAIVERLLARGARFRFVSKRLRDDLAAGTTAALLERSTVALCPVDVTGAPLRSDARARFGIAAGERVAVVVGRLVSDKRPLEAVTLALARRPNRIVVVGDGPLRASIERLDRRVVSVGLASHDDALAWIAAADVLVSASRNEGAPTAVREARALGVPVVAAPCGDLREWADSDAGIEIVTL